VRCFALIGEGEIADVLVDGKKVKGWIPSMGFKEGGSKSDESYRKSASWVGALRICFSDAGSQNI
jgi:hypothetical protein